MVSLNPSPHRETVDKWESANKFPPLKKGARGIFRIRTRFFEILPNPPLAKEGDFLAFFHNLYKEEGEVRVLTVKSAKAVV